MNDVIAQAIRTILREELAAAIAALSSFPASTPLRVECKCSCRCLETVDKNAEFWNTAQAAAYLGLSRKTVLNMCSTGEIPFIKNGRINAYRPAELELFRNERLNASG